MKRPLIPLPISAISSVKRVKLDLSDDSRPMGNKVNHLFELKVKDDFLPIYTHGMYSKVITDNAALVQLSPEQSSKRLNRDSKGTQGSIVGMNDYQLLRPGSHGYPFESEKQSRMNHERSTVYSKASHGSPSSDRRSVVVQQVLFDIQRLDTDPVMHRDSPGKR